MKSLHSFWAAYALCWAIVSLRLAGEGGQDEVRFYQQPSWPFLGPSAENLWNPLKAQEFP